MKEELLDDEQLKANRTNDSLEEIELLRATERHYEKGLLRGKLAMVFIGYLFLKNVSEYFIGSASFITYLVLGLFFFVGAYLVKYRPRIMLFLALAVYFILMTLSFIIYGLPPHGFMTAFLFIFFVGQSLTVAQKLTIVRQRLSENGEVPRYKEVWY